MCVAHVIKEALIIWLCVQQVRRSNVDLFGSEAAGSKMHKAVELVFASELAD